MPVVKLFNPCGGATTSFLTPSLQHFRLTGFQIAGVASGRGLLLLELSIRPGAPRV
jgi:hypothetical protein